MTRFVVTFARIPRTGPLAGMHLAGQQVRFPTIESAFGWIDKVRGRPDFFDLTLTEETV